ncbi:NAD(P)H:quinone oxidoreductase, type IV [Spizellomyces punctatus DAOM BR117]|uniref:NAD(P)H:quinone oxidoreductase, type IV n=1 Tax=Spizellomyces punctatus (strain DAOM BR117) TaxID=645134 RepID=A0A0L0HKH0_SPIPD|nr:NAD(P)H:quinone oxidoreductase, type IV [Spizellomyces punctatus DAOM BR117]KND01390.1 NAD(P)H:quinone oxidoreductase, type IV [Spizellomyces punctatus DAOM BR117]|eukprot:XP_016609429.1 NAD(P)H:quinone oxidoreductase, type IV [Spizellomyces punctatus DAOM BR117]
MSKPTVYVVIYSTWGHIKTLADSVVKGLREGGVNAELYQVAETLPQEVLDKMHAVKFDIPVLSPKDLVKADAFIFGIPTRYGVPAAQVKAFWDATGGLWAEGALVGKYAGVFTSTASQHGGQETTAMTFLPHLVHHGIIFVPLGYQSKVLFDNSEVVGGSPWGAGTVANGDGSRQPTGKELEIAETQGKTFAGTILKVHKP